MFERTPGYNCDDIPGRLPPDLVKDDTNLDEVAEVALAAVKALKTDAVTSDIQWRDWLSLTGQLCTIHGADNVVNHWTRASAQKHPQNFEVHRKLIVRPCKDSSWVAVAISYTTKQDNGLVGYHSATIGLTPVGDTWKIWLMVTILESFKGYGHPDEPKMAPEMQQPPATNLDGLDYAVAIVGAGQCGLSLAGRLKAVGLSSVVIEKASIGNAWTSKYDSIRQHTIREYNNLPFDRTWKQDDPELLPGKIVADGFSNYVKKYSLDVWTSSTITKCTRDDDSQTWTLEISSTDSAQPSSRTIKTRHLAVAVGAGVGMPFMPEIPGLDKFKGKSMHQSGFRNAKSFTGKRGIVVGTGTSGHDIAQDMFNNGMSVTMIQRSKTAIYPIEWVVKSQQAWNMNTPTIVSDRMSNGAPIKMGNEIITRNMREAAKRPEYVELFDGLERAGFKLDREAMMLDQIMSRYGGYYIDVGTCRHIANGEIKVKSGVPIKAVTETGLLFDDGQELPADLIVFATGYDMDYRKAVAGIVGDEMAEKLPEFWGLNKDGDVRGFMQENRPGLWMVGGTANQARWTSRFIALKMLLSLVGVNNMVE